MARKPSLGMGHSMLDMIEGITVTLELKAREVKRL